MFVPNRITKNGLAVSVACVQHSRKEGEKEWKRNRTTEGKRRRWNCLSDIVLRLPFSRISSTMKIELREIIRITISQTDIDTDTDTDTAMPLFIRIMYMYILIIILNTRLYIIINIPPMPNIQKPKVNLLFYAYKFLFR